jgi:homospermidine synthase
MVDEITEGIDELGVLLMGNPKGVYWYGSRLSIGEARRVVTHNNATSLQVTVSVLAAAIWAIENPKAGLVEPEQIDFERILEISAPYLGDMVGVWGDWTPLQDRAKLFEEDIDSSDPWQFKNIRVI